MEKIFKLNGETFKLTYAKNDIKCFINQNADLAIITNQKDNVLFEIQADCNQNKDSSFIWYNAVLKIIDNTY